MQGLKVFELWLMEALYYSRLESGADDSIELYEGLEAPLPSYRGAACDASQADFALPAGLYAFCQFGKGLASPEEALRAIEREALARGWVFEGEAYYLRAIREDGKESHQALRAIAGGKER
jgi:hypothetical protein